MFHQTYSIPNVLAHASIKLIGNDFDIFLEPDSLGQHFLGLWVQGMAGGVCFQELGRLSYFVARHGCNQSIAVAEGL